MRYPLLTFVLYLSSTATSDAFIYSVTRGADMLLLY